MDNLTLLRALRADVPDVSHDALDAGRTDLDARFADSASRSPAPRWPWMLASAAAAVALGVVLIVVPPLAPTPAYPAAAAVLRDAADRSAFDVDPTIAPNEFLMVDSTITVTRSGAAPDGAIYAWLERYDSTVFVAGDADVEWTWVRGEGRPFSFFGEGAADFASQVGAEQRAETIRARAGAFYGQEPEWPVEYLASLPRDPQQLLDALYTRGEGAGPSQEGQAFSDIVEIMSTGLATSELRAALYDAAALIPGVVVLASATDLNGREGTALGRLEEVDGLRLEMIVDRKTGEYLGHRMVSVEGWPAAGIPAGAVLEWSSVSTSVTDSVPIG